MDDVETPKTKNDGFLNHVFNFDTETKSNLMNIITISCFSNNTNEFVHSFCK